MKNLVYGPVDVVAGVVGFLRSHGVDARTHVPTVLAPGAVRVSRVTGEVAAVSLESARIWVEVWHETQLESFDLARSLFALFAAVESQDALPGVTTTRVEPVTTPAQLADERAPGWERHVFEVEIYASMVPMEVE